jgi:hypothetical protein
LHLARRLPCIRVQSHRSVHVYFSSKLLVRYQMAESHLLSLPRELRDIIYAHVLPERVKLTDAGCERSPSFFDANGIFLASQQFRREATETFWRLLPRTTIVISRQSHIPFLGSSQYSRLRRHTQSLVIQMAYIKRNSPIFELEQLSYRSSKSYLGNFFQSMPALQQLTCEIKWQPNDTPSILLPGDRSDMLREIRRVTIGEGSMIFWDIECYIVDATRWNKEWSGVVRFNRKSISKCHDSEEYPPPSVV